MENWNLKVFSKIKIVWKDAGFDKCVVGAVLSESSDFIDLRASGSGLYFKISKAAIISLREVVE